ncbi:MAG: hypothetical protein ACXWYP_05175, partial [Pseudonocardia sp.]
MQTGERPRGPRTTARSEGEPAQRTEDPASGPASTAPSSARARHWPRGPADHTSRRGVPGLVGALRGRTRLPHAAAFLPAAVFLAVRAVGIAVLGLMTAGRGTPLATELRSWDGVWMLSIAQYGYDGVPVTLVDAFGRHTPDTPYAFFPGYPAAIATVGVLTGGNLVVAALLVTTLAGVVTAYGLVRLAELMPGGSRRAGLLLVALFAAAPMGVVLSMACTEALFCALAVWALVGVLRRQWLLAGFCSAAAGLVRPTGSALALAVGLAALAAVVARRDGVRPWLAGLLAASGLLGYLGYVGWRTGTPTGWFDIQRTGWGSQFDGGASLVRFVGRTLRSGHELYDLAVLLTLVGSIVLLAVAVRMRLPWPVLVYAAAVLITVWCSDGQIHSRVRLLLPAFPLLLPVALGLARRRTGTAVAV